MEKNLYANISTHMSGGQESARRHLVFDAQNPNTSHAIMQSRSLFRLYLYTHPRLAAHHLPPSG